MLSSTESAHLSLYQKVDACLFPKASLCGVQSPMMEANGRINIPGLPNGMSVEAYIPLLHLYTSILEADRLIQPFRKALSLKPRTLGNQLSSAVTALDASKLTSNLFYKREDQTAIKAYKARGAFCGMKRVMDTSGEDNFLAVSTGNHALGVLKAAELLHPKKVKIVVPNNTSEVKLKTINSKVLGVRHKGVDASVLYLGDTFDEARDWAISQQLGGDGYYLDPYSNPWVVAGQGTIGLEIFRQLGSILQQRPEVEEVVVVSPIGGGGLLAGTATALRMAAAWDARFRQVDLKFVGLRLQNLFTKYGDAIRVKSVAEGNQLVFETLGIPQFKISDEMMAWGMQYALNDLGDKIEGPSGATVYTALHRKDCLPSEKRLVVCIVSGGNVGAFPTA
jgi:threonine dehydratase